MKFTEEIRDYLSKHLQDVLYIDRRFESSPDSIMSLAK